MLYTDTKPETADTDKSSLHTTAPVPDPTRGLDPDRQQERAESELGRWDLRTRREVLAVLRGFRSIGIALALGMSLLLPSGSRAQTTASAPSRESGEPVPKSRPKLAGTKAHLEVKHDADSRLRYCGESCDSRYMHSRQAEFSLEVPLLDLRFLVLSLSSLYDYYHAEELVYDSSGDYHVLGASTKVMLIARLFDRIISTHAELTAESTERGYERLIGRVSSVMILRRSRSAMLAIGVVGIMDSIASVPALPVFVYRNGFDRYWEADVKLPQLARMRYHLDENNRLSVGVSIEADHYYLRPDGESPVTVVIYRKTTVAPELVFERTVGQGVELALRAGVAVLFSGRLYDKEGSQVLVKFYQPAIGFLSAGISYDTSRM